MSKVLIFWIAAGVLASLFFLVVASAIPAYIRFADLDGFHRRKVRGRKTVGFFHPFAHAGGGGERVLWSMVKTVQERYSGTLCVIYTGDTGVTKQQFLELASDRFGIEVDPEAVEFVYLAFRSLVESKTWWRFTLLGQAIGSVILGWEASFRFKPDLLIDSMGYAFAYFSFRFGMLGTPICCYVHYPTISVDMLSRVQKREIGVCNDASVAKSDVLSILKTGYYYIVAAIYSIAGRQANVIMVNSSWTRGHIDQLWKLPQLTKVVFPPCDTTSLCTLPLERESATLCGNLVLSLAQFRPEKDHALQVRSLAKLYEIAPHLRKGKDHVRLIMAGGCRDSGDRDRVNALRELCRTLGLNTGEWQGQKSGEWDVCIMTNASGTQMRELLSQATVGLHTMREEHFGINVVEFMAAGCIALAHNSGGPKMDIINNRPDGKTTGYLASDDESYATALMTIFSMPNAERIEITTAARNDVARRFPQENFEELFNSFCLAQATRQSAIGSKDKSQ